MGRITVLHVAALAAGGMRQHIGYLLRWLDRASFRTLVAWPEANGGGQEWSDVPVFHLNLAERLRPADRALVGALADLLRREKVDLLHLHGVRAWLLGVSAAGQAGVPVVYTAHGPVPGRPPYRWIWRALRGWLLARTDGVIAVSRPLAAELGERAQARVRVIPNGIDLARFSGLVECGRQKAELGLRPLAPVVGAAARLTEAKGVDVLLRAVALLGPNLRDLQVLVLGDGPDRARLEKLARRLGLQDRVIFAGQRADVQAFLPLMHVFVLPSRREGFPLGLLEAMAARRPVVASAVGGVPEVIRHGENGLLVPPEDPAALAAALRWLLRDPAGAARLGQQARRDVEADFSAERMVAETALFYRQVLARPRGVLEEASRKESGRHAES